MLLANYYLRLFSEEHKMGAQRFSPSALAFLKGHSWPGNVRELRNRVQRAVIMCDAKTIDAVDLGGEPDISGISAAPHVAFCAGPRTLREAKDSVEYELIAEELKRNDGNIVKTAETLGVSRPTLYSLLKKHDLLRT